MFAAAVVDASSWQDAFASGPVDSKNKTVLPDGSGVEFGPGTDQGSASVISGVIIEQPVGVAKGFGSARVQNIQVELSISAD